MTSAREPAPVAAGVTTRPLRSGDVHAVARIHTEAFFSTAGGQLGARYADALMRFFSDHPAAIALVVAVDDRIGGYVMGVDMTHEESLVRAMRMPAIYGLMCRPQALASPVVWRKLRQRISDRWRGRVDGARLPPLQQPCMGLFAIGVASSMRGKNLSAALLEAFEQHSAQRAMRSMLLSVHTDNASARRAYAKAGWRASDAHAFAGRALWYTKDIVAVTS